MSYQEGAREFRVTLRLLDQWAWLVPPDPPDPDARDDEYDVSSRLAWAPGLRVR